MENGSGLTATSPAISFDSGRDPAQFVAANDGTVLGSFPYSCGVASLATGQVLIAAGIVERDPMVQVDLGYDSARTVAPETIPAGGGEQTITVSLTPRHERFAAWSWISIFIGAPATDIRSLNVPANLDQGETLLPMDRGWTLVGGLLGKTYVFRAVAWYAAASPVRHLPDVQIYAFTQQVPCSSCSAPGLVSVPLPDLDGPSRSGHAAISVGEPVDIDASTKASYTTFYANVWEPIPACAPLVVTNTNDDGPCSLRAAIDFANADGVPSTIVFNIPTTDPGFNGQWFTIRQLSRALRLTDPETTIDGRTQTAFSGDTNPLGPEIFVDGRSMTGKPGFLVESAHNVIEGLTISGFPSRAIGISGSGNVIRGNYIGTDPTGRSAIENDWTGCCPAVVDNGLGTIIGGAGPGEGNLISGNHGPGLGLAVGSRGAIVQGNRIGTDATGTYAIPNAGGILVGGPNVGGDADDAIIGGTAAGAGNLISGNTASGIEIHGSGHVVQGNFIGTDITGTRAVGNGSDPTRGQSGLALADATHVQVGGTVPGARNVISGNSGGTTGIWIGGAASANAIQGNYIGTDVTGTVALGNREGIFFKILSTVMADNVIGGSAPGAGNVISGNLDRGIRLGGTRTRVEGNLIGTNASGTGPIPNLGDGVRAASACRFDCDAVIVGNTIAYNAGPGIATNDGPEIFTITRNAIYANGGLGIDLGGDGVTPNDPGDIDTGPNGLQNFPVIGTAETSGGTVTVTGGLDTPHPDTATVELFGNDASDPSGYGEGQRYVASITPSANGCFTATFSARTADRFFTSTATDAAGNTSEFSRAIPQGTTKAAIALSPATATNVVGTTHTVTATLTNTAGGPVPCATITFTVTGANIASGTGTTDINGTTSFSYIGNWAGDDTITAASGPARGSATKTWTFPASTAGRVTGGGQVATPTSTASFGLTAAGASGQLEFNEKAGRNVHGTRIAAAVISGMHATIYGFATVDGAGEVQFRVDVDDVGEPGTNDRFAIMTNDGYSAGGRLVSGNVQVH